MLLPSVRLMTSNTYARLHILIYSVWTVYTYLHIYTSISWSCLNICIYMCYVCGEIRRLCLSGRQIFMCSSIVCRLIEQLVEDGAKQQEYNMC
jgi:hypothetical protein